MAVRITRVYDSPAPSDGSRVLIDRIWPCGVSQSAANIDLWLPDVAPSSAVRQWFGHDLARWKECRRRYRMELRKHSDLAAPLREQARKGPMTSIYSTRDTEHNQAVVLLEWLTTGARVSGPASKR